MSIKQEFKDFIMRGNVVDLAVGMVVGTAFSGIVKSLVDDVIMPPHRPADRRRGLFQPVPHFEKRCQRPGRRLRLTGCRTSGRRGYPEPRPVHQQHHQLPHHRLRHLHGGQSPEHFEKTGSTGRRSTGRTERRSIAAARNPRFIEKIIPTHIKRPSENIFRRPFVGGWK